MDKEIQERAAAVVKEYNEGLIDIEELVNKILLMFWDEMVETRKEG